MGTIFHDDTKELDRVDRYADELDEIGMIQLLEVSNVGLLFRFDLLDGHLLVLVEALEDAALRAAVDPLQVGNALERNVKVVIVRGRVVLAARRLPVSLGDPEAEDGLDAAEDAVKYRIGRRLIGRRFGVNVKRAELGPAAARDALWQKVGLIKANI